MLINFDENVNIVNERKHSRRIIRHILVTRTGSMLLGLVKEIAMALSLVNFERFDGRRIGSSTWNTFSRF